MLLAQVAGVLPVFQLHYNLEEFETISMTVQGSANMCYCKIFKATSSPFLPQNCIKKKITRNPIRSGSVIKKSFQIFFLAWPPLSREFKWTSLKKVVNRIFFKSKWNVMVWLPATKAGTLKIKNDIPGFYSHYQFLSWSYSADLFCHWPLWCCKKKEMVWHNKSWCHFCCNCVIPDWNVFL